LKEFRRRKSEAAVGIFSKKKAFVTPSFASRAPDLTITEPVVGNKPREPRRAAQDGKNSDLPAIDGYEILSELGRGGMGLVYKARQLGLNRTVALKMVLGGAFADGHFLERFRIEAEAIAKLQHPNIVQIFATGTRRSPLGPSFAYPYFVQEYMEDGNLADLIEHKPQPAREAARLVETLARAVHYAHEHGIVHRDLKPANVLLRGKATDGRLSAFIPKICDFGLAKQLDSPNQPLTVTGTAAGTPEYMAPEQAACATKAGPAADIYSLGVILYELGTGRRPFEGATAIETMQMVIQQEALPPTKLNAIFPRDLETICLKCLRKEPQRRYASALDMAEDLRRFLEGEPILARPVSKMEKGWRWAKRRPAVAALAAVLALTAVGGACGITAAWLHALAGWREADIKQDEANRNRERAEQEQVNAERGREQAEQSLYFSRIAQARMESRLNNFASAEQILDQCLPADTATIDRRGWEWYYLKGILHADLLTIPSAHQDMVSDVAFSPDGLQLLTAGGTPFAAMPDRVKIWNVWGNDAGKVTREVPHTGRILRAIYMQRGQQILSAGADHSVRLADARSGKVMVTRPLPAGYHVIAIAPGGEFYAAADSHGNIGIWRLRDGQSLFSVRPGNRPGGMAGISPDDRTLAVCVGPTLQLWNIASGKLLGELPRAEGGHGSPAFSPDGKLLAHDTAGGITKIWDLGTRQIVQTLAGHAGAVLAVQFSPDGHRLATAGADRTVRIWSVESGAELLVLRGHHGRACCLSFHPSGAYLASGAEQPSDVKVWDLTRHQEYVNVVRDKGTWGRVEAIHFADDSKLVYIARSHGSLQISHTNSGVDRDVRTVDVTERLIVPATLAAFSRDGRYLATVTKDTHFVKVIDLASGNEIYRLEHPFGALQLTFSANGNRLTVASGDPRRSGQRAIHVWDMANGATLASLAPRPFPSSIIYGRAALSPDGTTLVYDDYHEDGKGGGGFTLKLWDIARAATIEAIGDMHMPIDMMVFSANGRYLAVSQDNTGVMIFDRQTHGWVTPAGLEGSVGEWFFDLAFSPDGARLAGVSREQVLLWDVASGEPLLTLVGAPPRPSDNAYNPHLAWSHDGKRLAAGNWDQTVSIWDANEQESVAARSTRHQAAEERARYQPK
jgi:WD40 repeat protein/serine/threonine protein kinase